MAIYHFSIKVISRGKGRSIVYAAANRSHSKLKDERTGITYYGNHEKKFSSHSFILLPDGAPTWMADREKLWNGVEERENRKNSITAKEVEVSLPNEFNFEQQLELMESFAQETFVNLGMVADVAIRSPLNPDRNKSINHHGTILLTTRLITPDGFGLKERAWNHKDYLFKWRKSWADFCNERFEKMGLPVLIDHRSNLDRGIIDEPQKKKRKL